MARSQSGTISNSSIASRYPTCPHRKKEKIEGSRKFEFNVPISLIKPLNPKLIASLEEKQRCSRLGKK